ncbi:LptA/OstA family protein [Maricaulis parjimensis]|uniref:LptA/OstA family protein n=1 Tax=Maricaulis parjimensis TaxID=144023 RepID=UPI0019394D38|nr:LptA/OstA family protein [Maricaulis parjimensis]
MMRQFLLGLALVLAGLVPAQAQIGNSSLPLDIEADHVDVLDAERRIIWQGNVNAIQGTSSIRAQRIDVFYTGNGTGSGTGGWGDIDRIVAAGDVYYITPTQRARGQEGVYTLATETIVLTGDVVINQGENVITATRFVTNLQTGNSSWESGEGGRVRAVLQTRQDGDTPADPDSPSNR